MDKKAHRITVNVLPCVILLLSCIASSGQEYPEIHNPENTVCTAARKDSLFLSAFAEQEYETAYSYVLELGSRDSLPQSLIQKCADCMVILGKNEECLDFCDRLAMKFGSDSLLVPVYGECHYYMGNYRTACTYLDRYFGSLAVSSSSSSSSIPYGSPSYSRYYSSLWAKALHESCRYEEADSIYTLYFNDVLAADNLKLDNDNMENLGRKLYDFAYNSFFMGNEAKGMALLKLSGEYGNEYATEDYGRLSRCSTVMMDLNFSNSLVRKFHNDIDRYDFDGFRDSTVRGDDVRLFWNAYLENNSGFRSLQQELAKDRTKKTLARAINDIAKGRPQMQKYLAECSPIEKSWLEDRLCTGLYGQESSTIMDLRIYPASELNAFATPYGQIYLTSGLVLTYHLNDKLLLGVCAHESVHSLCHHSLVGQWKQYEKERKNRIAGGILAGLYAATMAGAAIYGASGGATYDRSFYNGLGNTTVQIYRTFEDGAYYYQFKYSREQEIEADLAAYRYCEATGIGGYAYIMALQLLRENDMYMKSAKTDDHPAIAYRIGLLKYLYLLEHQAD
ncbi:MAG: M48 family metalloprotease [Bacteroidales bacterium]|nr:M48 family metalloprotease [Bacteroidales bacterium]